MDIDTSAAQQKVEQLDDSTKSLQDRLENVGGSGKKLGDGISSGVGNGITSLDKLGGTLGQTVNSAASVGTAGQSAGIKLSSAMNEAANNISLVDISLDDAEAGAKNLAKVGEETGGRIRKAFENASDASDSMGTSFAKNFNNASQSGNSFSKSIRVGAVGAFDTAKKHSVSFIKDTVGGFKKVGNAILHPVQTLKGKFSGAMKDAATDTGKIGDKASNSKKDLDGMGNAGSSAGDKMQKGFGAALKVIAAIAAAAVVVVGLAKFTGAALEASKAAENISYSFDKTFGDNAPNVDGWAKNFSGAVHRSSSEVKSFLTSNKQLYEGMGITGDAANNLSKATTSMAFDIGNKFGVQDSEALSQLQDAISGNKEALGAYGVKLDDVTLKASSMKMGLGSNLETMDEATLAQVRFNAIMEQTGDIQQNASKSLGGYAGGVKAVKAVWTDFLEKVGTKLAPTFDKVFGVILNAWPKVEPALMSFADLLANGFEQAAPILADFATNLLPQLLGLAAEMLPMLMQVGGELLPLISQVLGTVVQAFTPLMPVIETLIKTLLPPLAQLFGTLVETLLPPLATLLGALAPVIEALSPVLEIAASGIGLVAEGIAGLIGWLTKGIEKVGEFATSLKNSPVGNFATGVGDGIKGAAGNVKNFFAGNAKGTDNFEGGWSRVHEAGDEIIQAKHGEGIAYLPRGSAVIPASKTEEILSGDKAGGKVINITAMLQANKSIEPQPNWVPRLLENIPSISKNTDDGGSPEDRDNPKNPPPPPEPPPPSAGGGEQVIRKIIELNVNVTSSDGTVPQEVRDEIRRMVLLEVNQIKDDELDDLAIQKGYA